MGRAFYKNGINERRSRRDGRNNDFRNDRFPSAIIIIYTFTNRDTRRCKPRLILFRRVRLNHPTFSPVTDVGPLFHAFGLARRTINAVDVCTREATQTQKPRNPS